jgi:hypothetical protein
MIIIWVCVCVCGWRGGCSGEDKEGDKHDLELEQSFTEVQHAYEMLSHSLQCTALVSGMKKTF